MQMPLCSRCHKNVAVVFITKLDEGQSSNQGYCLKCAREIGLKPIDGIMQQMGISEVDTTGPKAEDYLMQRLVEEGGQLEAPTDYITLR